MRKFIIAASALAMIAGFATSASAATLWEKNHPRRDQVNDRLHNQDKRIRQERREGEITKSQARLLHKQDRRIRQEERDMASFNHGHITKYEQHALNHQLNKVSRRIGD